MKNLMKNIVKVKDNGLIKTQDLFHELFNDDTAHTMIKYLYRQIPEVINAFEALPEVILRMDFSDI